jgi:hypothetical protein
MTWNSVAVAPTQPQIGWWTTPPAPVAAPAASWGSSPLYIQPTGIPSAEAFGIPMVSMTISPTGIPSAEAFGVPTIMNVKLFPPQQVRVAVQRAATI